MNKQIYDKVTELQDLVTEQSNILADIIELLNELALVYENAERELLNEN